jgi:hypothetical protein
MTIVSGSTLYLTPAEFLRYYDSRVVAELLSDTGTKVIAPAGDPNLAELLKAACGEVEAAALRGGRYTSDDLTAIAASGTHGGSFLKKLVAGSVMQALRFRRARVGEDLLEQFKWLTAALKELRQGEQILGFLETQTAATTQADHDTLEKRQERRGISVNASPYFGIRGGDRR